jgi:hypothetical protein
VTDLVVVIAAQGHMELHLGSESGLLRERLGMTAWVALEALVLAAAPDGRGGVTVAASARDLAARLGIGKDRAAAALAVLRDAGLLVPVASSVGRSGRFVAHRYEIHVPVSVTADAERSVARESRPSGVRRVVHDGARLFEVES